MFIVSLTYKVSLEEVERYLPDHVEYLKCQYEKRNFLASGRKVPRDGGVILSNLATKEELMKVINQDPFKINNIALYEITEFVPSMTSEELSFLR